MHTGGNKGRHRRLVDELQFDGLSAKRAHQRHIIAVRDHPAPLQRVAACAPEQRHLAGHSGQHLLGAEAFTRPRLSNAVSSKALRDRCTDEPKAIYET